MKKLIIFLMVISLIFMSVAPSVFGAFTKINVGPDTDFDGDINIPTGKSYYINEVLLAVTDITTEDLIDKAMFKDEDWGDLSVSTNDVTIDEDVIDKANFADEDWGELTVSTNDITIDDDVIDIEHFVHSADLGDIIVNVGGTAIEIDADSIDIDTFLASADLGEIAVDAGGANIEIEDDVLGIEHFVHSADLGEIIVNAGGTAFEIDDDVIDIEHFLASQDWGEVSVNGAGDAVEIDDDVIGTDHLGDEDWGDVNIDTGVAQVQDLTMASEAAGDVIYFDGSNWVVLAKDAGKFLKSGASAVSWDVTSWAGNLFAHFMDVDAAGDAYVHANIEGTGGAQDISTAITNPDYGRNVTITITNNDTPSGNVTITGNLADGTTAQTDVIAITPGTTVDGVKAFVTVTNINIPAGVPAGDYVSVGIGDLFGLPNSIDAVTDVYNKTVDGVNEFDEISGNVNTTNNTVDCATVAQHEDISFAYHQ